jgi:hypothetical protein
MERRMLNENPFKTEKINSALPKVTLAAKSQQKISLLHVLIRNVK